MKKVIGLDIGGTKIAGIVFDGQKILREQTVPTPKNLPEFRNSLLKIVADLSAGLENVEGVGIGTAGLVDPDKGVLSVSPNIKYIKNFNFIKFFNSYDYGNIKVDNDANCFTRAELALGYGKKCKDFIAMTLGTGIGGGIVVGGKIYRGRHHKGAEIGKLVFNGKSLEYYYQQARDKKDYKELANLLAVGFASAINILDPACIILGGSIGQLWHRHFLLPSIRQTKKYLLNKGIKPKILISKLKQPGAIGASLMFYQ